MACCSSLICIYYSTTTLSWPCDCFMMQVWSFRNSTYLWEGTLFKRQDRFSWWGALGLGLFGLFWNSHVHPMKLAVHKSPWGIHQGLQNNRAVRPNYM